MILVIKSSESEMKPCIHTF